MDDNFKSYVKLDIKEYRTLVDFERNIKEGGNLYTYHYDNYNNTRAYIFLDIDEEFKKVMETNERQKLIIQEKDVEMAELYIKPKYDPKHRDLYDVSRMSIWGFIKWRRTQR